MDSMHNFARIDDLQAPGIEDLVHLMRMLMFSTRVQKLEIIFLALREDVQSSSRLQRMNFLTRSIPMIMLITTDQEGVQMMNMMTITTIMREFLI